MFKTLLFNKSMTTAAMLRPTTFMNMPMFNMMTMNTPASRMMMNRQLLKPQCLLMGAAYPRFNFIARAPQGLSEYQEEKKVLLPFTTQYLWNNIGARTTYKIVGRGPGSGLG